MASQVKRFRDHSTRWQRAALRRGVDPGKWDRWRTLSSKSRKVTDPYEYATGKPVREQIRSQLLDAAAEQVAQVHTTLRGARRDNGQIIRTAAVRRNLGHPEAGVSNARLRKIASMSPGALSDEIDESLSRRYSSGERSPFWYEKRG